MNKYAEVLNMIKKAYPQVARAGGPAWRRNLGSIGAGTSPAAPSVQKGGRINGKPVSQIYPKQSRIYTSPPANASPSTTAPSTTSAVSQTTTQELPPVQQLSPQLQAQVNTGYKSNGATGSDMTTAADLFARPNDAVFSSQQEKRQYFNNDTQRIAQYDKALEDAAATKRELARGQLYLAGRNAVNNAGQALTNAVQGGVNAMRTVAGTPSNSSWTTSVDQLGRRPVSRGRIYNRPGKHYYGRTWKGY